MSLDDITKNSLLTTGNRVSVMSAPEVRILFSPPTKSQFANEMLIDEVKLAKRT